MSVKRAFERAHANAVRSNYLLPEAAECWKNHKVFFDLAMERRRLAKRLAEWWWKGFVGLFVGGGGGGFVCQITENATRVRRRVLAIEAEQSNKPTHTNLGLNGRTGADTHVCAMFVVFWEVVVVIRFWPEDGSR